MKQGAKSRKPIIEKTPELFDCFHVGPQFVSVYDSLLIFNQIRLIKTIRECWFDKAQTIGHVRKIALLMIVNVGLFMGEK